MGCASSQNRISNPVLLKKPKMLDFGATPLTNKDQSPKHSSPRRPRQHKLSLNLSLVLPDASPLVEVGPDASRGERKAAPQDMFTIKTISPASKPRRLPSITVFKNRTKFSQSSFISIGSLDKTLKKAPTLKPRVISKMAFLSRDTIIYPLNSTNLRDRNQRNPRFSVVTNKEVGNFEKYMSQKLKFTPPQRRSIKGTDHEIVIRSPVEDVEGRRKSLNPKLNVNTRPFLIQNSLIPRKRKNSKVNAKNNSFSISSASKSQKTILKDLSPNGFNCDASLVYASSIASREREPSANSRIFEDLGNVSLAMVFKENRKLLRQKHRRLSKNQLFQT